jgi:hypothetical protein
MCNLFQTVLKRVKVILKQTCDNLFKFGDNEVNYKAIKTLLQNVDVSVYVGKKVLIE